MVLYPICTPPYIVWFFDQAQIRPSEDNGVYGIIISRLCLINSEFIKKMYWVGLSVIKYGMVNWNKCLFFLNIDLCVMQYIKNEVHINQSI